MFAKLLLATLLLFPWWSGDRSDAWLGVVMVDIPEALAAHLKPDQAGLMVINVVTDSPADEAGIRQYDVIARVDGEEVGEGPDRLGELIRQHEPGDKVTLKIVRGLETKTIDLPLGEHPKGPVEYRYEKPADTWLSDRMDITGTILKKLPHGEWQVEQLGRLKDLPGLESKSFAELFVTPDVFEMELGDRGEDVAIKVREVDDDQVLTVETTKEGKIRVTREWEEHGDQYQKMQEYDNAKELKKADKEAYELYRSVCPADRKGKTMTFRLGSKDKRLQEVDEDAVIHVERALRQAREQLEKAKEEMKANEEDHRDALRGHEFHRAFRQAEEQLKKVEQQMKGKEKAYLEALRAHQDVLRFIPRFKMLYRDVEEGERGFRFEPGEDDEIIVVFDSDDDEVVIIFNDAEDLKDHSPELYTAFRKHQRGEDEEGEVTIELDVETEQDQ